MKKIFWLIFVLHVFPLLAQQETIRRGEFEVVTGRRMVYSGAAVGNSPSANGTALIAAINSINGKGVVVIEKGTYSTNSITIPDSVVLNFMPGAILSPASGQTLTINGNIDTTPDQKIFAGDGTVLTPHQKVYPEWFGAKGDGITDNSSILVKTFNSTSPEIELNTGTYLLTTKDSINLSGRNVRLFSNGSSALLLTDVSSTGGYYSPSGGLYLRNGKVEIEGITFNGTNTSQNPNVNQLSVLQIEGCSKVKLNNVHITGGIYAGFQAINDTNLSVTNSTFNNNLYAGVIVRGTDGVNFSNCEFSYNGYNDSYDFGGYGITVSGRFPYPFGSGTSLDNKNITIENCVANYNNRSNIDVHGGIGVVIRNNFITGFGNRAIYAVNEGGETGYEKVVKDVLIEGNIIKNDTTWYKTLTGTPYQYVIGVGSWGAVGNIPEDGGNVEVTHNQISDIATADLQLGIWCYLNPNGVRMKNIRITDNIISDSARYIYCPIGVKTSDTSLAPEYVEISRNKIKGYSVDDTTGVAIYIQKGLEQRIVDNVISGNFPISVAGSVIPMVKRGNTLNNVNTD